MPIKDIQIRMRELGRIRMGRKQASKSGKGTFPTKLSTWRLTSQSKELLEALAGVYGGTVARWEDEKAPGVQWELTTTTSVLDVIVPPGQVGSQWYEMWSADGCTRRCDGEVNQITGKACACPADLNERAELAAKGKACKPTTRLSLILKGCPEVGLWRVQSTGRNAATEMAAIAQVCELATAQDRVIPGTLRLEQRTAKKPGQPTSHFVVPVLEVGHGLDEILNTLGMLTGDTFAPSIAAPPSPAALPEARPDLPPDPGFRGQEPAPVAFPPAPEPGPAVPTEYDDEEIVEAEIVDTAEGGGDGPAEAVAAPVDDEPWTADEWQAEAKARGIARRDLIMQARTIAAEAGVKSPSSFADLTEPTIATPLRAWLNQQGA